ncbi:MAG: RNA-binding domain-containing protein [Candidatus Korarchaeum sp.]
MASLTAEISTMVYPTEVEGKVRELLHSLCGEDCSVREERFSSHYGYSFKVLTCEVTPELTVELLKRVICSLDRFDLMSLMETLDTRLEGRNLYIRLSKQDLAMGTFRLYKGDPGGYLRLKFSFDKAVLEDVRDALIKVGRDCTQT